MGKANPKDVKRIPIPLATKPPIKVPIAPAKKEAKRVPLSAEGEFQKRIEYYKVDYLDIDSADGKCKATGSKVVSVDVLNYILKEAKKEFPLIFAPPTGYENHPVFIIPSHEKLDELAKWVVKWFGE